MSQRIKGIGASAGIAVAKAFKLEDPILEVEKKTIEDPEQEIKRFTHAIVQSKRELETIKNHAGKELGEDKAAIFAAHLLVLDDPELIDNVKNKINDENVNAESALDDVTGMFISMFENMDNEYMKERAADIRDVRKRVLAHLLNVTITTPSMITEEVIIISEDLTPSDTAQLNRNYVKGFATDIGGRTSHSAIMARSMEIPAVVGTKMITNKVENGTTVIIDGIDGDVVIDPTGSELDDYIEKRYKYIEQKKEWAKLVNESSITNDGQRVELAANIGTPQDLKGVINNGAEAIGLYRTEFLYMNREQLPTEEEQFEAYKEVLSKMEGKPVVIRTLDIGGDKELPYLDLPKELNPFLGYRAIRLCLDEQSIFRTQLRALLRASAFGNLKVMFPMIATLDEFRQAKSILKEEQQKLRNDNLNVSNSIEIGMMVEIPAAAVMADQFAKEVDFFSIGTNDLIQYTMAADRMNEQVAYLYQPYNPGILRLVKNVIDAAHKEGKWAGMCGEMAGDETAIPLLLGLGLDEFSMSATSVLPARSQLRRLDKTEIADKMDEVLQLDSAQQVKEYVQKHFLK
ncbi:phosphoenolpyruvate--protein phosphotransferase [Pseudalkalibacillus decolorationis]|uniref:phosphoenolpyruvate--protein phosphotransferase n=1 Tax=Pseudalkalibacillus decolorationis TaxID=163879 RepID=UPI002147385B|nr:phosphoenolpyruvate--protein phosphotransferase [Pseudalkalibacillus decolorationis]